METWGQKNSRASTIIRDSRVNHEIQNAIIAKKFANCEVKRRKSFFFLPKLIFSWWLVCFSSTAIKCHRNGLLGTCLGTEVTSTNWENRRDDARTNDASWREILRQRSRAAAVIQAGFKSLSRDRKIQQWCCTSPQISNCFHTEYAIFASENLRQQ